MTLHLTGRGPQTALPPPAPPGGRPLEALPGWAQARGSFCSVVSLEERRGCSTRLSPRWEASAGKPLTWCQERVEGLGRRGWPGHQGVQVHQGRVGAQEGLGGFPGAAGLARGHGQGLRLKGVGACSSTFLGRQRGHRLGYKTTTDTSVVSRREGLRLLHPRCSRPGRREPRRGARTRSSPWGCGGGMLIAGLLPSAPSWRQGRLEPASGSPAHVQGQSPGEEERATNSLDSSVLQALEDAILGWRRGRAICLSKFVFVMFSFSTSKFSTMSMNFLIARREQIIF